MKKKLQKILLIVVCSLLLLNNAVLATAPVEPEGITELPSMGGYLFRIIVSMIFIVIVTYLVMKLLRRQNNLLQRQKSWLKIYDYQGLGNNRGIYLVEILGQVYVMAVSDGHFSILREIDPEDEYWNDIKSDIENTQEDIIPSNIKKWLAGNIGKYGPTNSATDKSFEKELDKQLDRSKRLFRRISQGGQDDE